MTSLLGLMLQKMTQQSWSIIQNLSEIINDSAQIGVMNLDIFEFEN